MTNRALYPGLTLRRELDRLFGEWPDRQIAWHPTVDIRETEEAFVVTAELPGIAPANVRVGIENTLLKISGEKKDEAKGREGVQRYRSERAYGKFERTFRLPRTVDAERINASYSDGVLTVTLPKLPIAQPREIPVGVS
jgi:HSP20 family protein